MSTYNDVPFYFFCDLVRAIGSVGPESVAGRRKPTARFDYPALNIFERWVKQLRAKYSPLRPGTSAICFKFLFPEEDVRRKYNIQETAMMKSLVDSLGKQKTDFDGWNQTEVSGCLGHEVKNALAESCPNDDEHRSDMTLSQIDELLDELAALSPYSHKDIRFKHPKYARRPRKEVIKSLFRGLSPLEAGVLTQIILKDLRPMLYPLTEFHYRVALINFNTKAVRMLSLTNAMYAWDSGSSMSNFYRMRASLDEAAAFADATDRSIDDIVPKVGVQIAIPKSEKGLDCTRAVKHFAGSDYVWAETKYDGERAQIHVQVDKAGQVKIQIFSKSGRESTDDRRGVHDIIRATLDLDAPNENYATKHIQNVILDAEMVAFRGEKIEEFWHIRQLIAQTAVGIRNKQSRNSIIEDTYEHESMNSADTDGLSLGLVFFDVLYLNDESLLARSYRDRRAILESLISILPGQAILAARYRIDMLPVSKPNRRFFGRTYNKFQPTSEDNEAAAAKLCWIFASHIAAFEEGLVVKAEDSRYNDWNKQWVKLKKDYIPGYGDCVDMVILGASWEKERARTLRAPPSVFTTFHVGVLENKAAIEQNPRIRPCFHIYFTVSYGLTREQLEKLNFLVKSSDTITYQEFEKHKDREFNITTLSTTPKPEVILQTPLLFELFGAGFTKAAHSHHYELRFPRVSKYYRPSERSWQDGVDSEALHQIACASVGRDISDWVIDRDMRALFGGVPPSPGVRCPERRERVTQEWFDKLSEAERKPGRKRPEMDELDITAFPVPSSVMMTPSKDRTTTMIKGLLPVADKGEDWRGNVKPLNTRTNVDDSRRSADDVFMCKGMPVVTPERSLRLAIAQAPITPPASSPLRNNENEAFESPLKKRARSPSPSRKHQKVLKLSSPDHVHISKPALELDIPSSAQAEQTLPSQQSEVEGEMQAKPDELEYPPGVELDSTFAFFARPTGTRCEQYRGWRKKIPRRIHTLSAVKVGCGWTEQGLGHRQGGVQGVIIVDECDEEIEARMAQIRGELAVSPTHEHLPIRVYGCRSTTTPLLEFM